MPDLLAEMNAAAEAVRQPHLDRIKELGVTGDAMGTIWREQGQAPFGIVNVEITSDGTFLPGVGPAYIVQPVTIGGEIVDLVAWRSMRPERWVTRTGAAWALGEDALEADYWNLTEPHAPTIRATPLDWLRAAGDGFCILDWDAPDVRGLVSLDAIRCPDRRLSQTLLAAISKPVRLPRILPTEALRNAA